MDAQVSLKGESHMQRAEVFRVPMSGPGDVSGLAELIDSGRLRAEEILAIVAKTDSLPNPCLAPAPNSAKPKPKMMYA